MSDLSQFVVAGVIFFCRIGACLTVAAGFSSARIPVRVRLFLAVSITLALTPMLLERHPEVGRLIGVDIVAAIAHETFFGLLLGFVSRSFLWALQFIATAISTYIGLTGLPGASVDDGEPVPGFAALAGALAVVLIFLTDLHWRLLEALVGSYDLVGPGSQLSFAEGLERHVSVLSTAFLVGAQIAGPFFAFTLTVNLAFGLVNKTVPQIPAYFISVPFVIAGGLLLIYIALADMFRVFLSAIELALERG